MPGPPVSCDLLIDGGLVLVLEDGRAARVDVREVVAGAQGVANRLWRESGWTPVLAAAEP